MIGRGEILRSLVTGYYIYCDQDKEDLYLYTKQYVCHLVLNINNYLKIQT